MQYNKGAVMVIVIKNKSELPIYEQIKQLPLIDYHNHLSIQDIQQNIDSDLQIGSGRLIDHLIEFFDLCFIQFTFDITVKILHQNFMKIKQTFIVVFYVRRIQNETVPCRTSVDRKILIL